MGFISMGLNENMAAVSRKLSLKHRQFGLFLAQLGC
jgi:hypothetical protein